MYYPYSENKSADQLRGYREADLRLCFRLGKTPVFSRCGSSDNEKNILNKGLKFTPVPTSSDSNELKSDIHEFTRKLRLVEYFEGMEDIDISLRRNRSDFVPSRNRNIQLDKYIQSIEEFPLEPKRKTKPNISKLEAEAIKLWPMTHQLLLRKLTRGVQLL